LGVRAPRPRPGSLRSASSSLPGCGSGVRTRRTEQPLCPRASAGAVVAEDERLLRGVRLLRRMLQSTLLRASQSLGYEMMVGRELTDRIRVRRVAREEIRLATATAEVPPALRAAAARLLHPVLAAVMVECRRFVPDRADARRAHARE